MWLSFYSHPECYWKCMWSIFFELAIQNNKRVKLGCVYWAPNSDKSLFIESTLIIYLSNLNIYKVWRYGKIDNFKRCILELTTLNLVYWVKGCKLIKNIQLLFKECDALRNGNARSCSKQNTDVKLKWNQHLQLLLM